MNVIKPYNKLWKLSELSQEIRYYSIIIIKSSNISCSTPYPRFPPPPPITLCKQYQWETSYIIHLASAICIPNEKVNCTETKEIWRNEDKYILFS